MNLAKIEKKILSVENVISIHEFHVWQLTPEQVFLFFSLSHEQIIATVHVTVKPVTQTNLIVDEIKRIFHKYNIHSSTVQLEYCLPTSSSMENVNSAPYQSNPFSKHGCNDLICENKKCVTNSCCH